MSFSDIFHGEVAGCRPEALQKYEILHERFL